MSGGGTGFALRRPAVTLPWDVVSMVAAGLVLGALIGRGDALLAAVAVAGAIGAAVTWRRPALVAGGFIALSPLVGYYSVLSFGSLPDVTVERVLAAWLVAVLLMTRAAVPKDGEAGTEGRARIALPAAFVVAGVLIAAVRATYWGLAVSAEAPVPLQSWLDQYALPMALLVACSAVPWTDRERRATLWLLVVSGAGWSVLAAVEFVTHVNVWAPDGVPPWQQMGFVRPGGPFVNPSVLGTALGLSVIAALVLFIYPGRYRALLAVCIAACVGGLVLTLTRGPWLGLVVAVVVTALALGRRGVVVAGGWAAAGAAVVYGIVSLVGSRVFLVRLVQENSVEGRFIVQRAALGMLGDSAGLGIGLGQFAVRVRGTISGIGDMPARYGAGVFAPHNTVLHVAVESGVPTAVAFVALYVVLTRTFLLRLRAQGADRWTAVAGLGFLACWWVNALTLDMGLTAHLNAMFAVLVGMMAAPRRAVAEADPGGGAA